MYQVDYHLLGKEIRRYRKLRKLSQAQLAEMSDLSVCYIGHIERGSRRLSMDTFISICYALEVSPNRLLYDSLPDEIFGELLDTPLVLRQPDMTLRNTLSNWYFADLPDMSIMGEPEGTQEQLDRLQFCLLGEEMPVPDFL